MSTTKQSRKAKRMEADEAREELRKIIKPGDTVYCILRHVSRSGMQRVIDLHVMTTDADGRPWLRPIGPYAARAMGDRYDYKRNGIIASGCGMDMGFHLVYSLGYRLWPAGFGCIGEGCRSNDHSNGDRDYRPHMDDTPQCSEEVGTDIPRLRSYRHWHRDGGYALRHEWI